MKPIKFTYNYVYIVLEHHNDKHDSIIHGAYINRSEAEGKANKIKNKTDVGYVAILKKPVQGKQPVLGRLKAHADL